MWQGRKAAFAAMGRDLAELLRPGRRRPAHEAARGAAPDRRARGRATACGSANVFHAGDGNLHPLVLYDDAVDGRGGARRAAARRDPRRLHRRRRLADRRARRRRRQGVLDAEAVRRATISRRCSGSARALRPGRARQSRQGVPDAAAVRRGAGAVPRAPTGAGGRLPSVSEPGDRSRRRRAVLAAGGRVSIEREGGEVVLSTARPEPGARARAGRPDRDRRGGHPAVRRCRRRLAPHGQMLALDPPAIRRSARAWPATSPGRAAIATARCATS